MSKQKFNYHTHTIRCGHAQGLDEQYVQSAINAGFQTLGFSDHIPFPEIRTVGDRMLCEQQYDYLVSIENLKKQYASSIDIKVGYEVEYLDDHKDYLIQMRKTCDYMILGQHLKELGYEYDCYCSDDDVEFYVQQVEAALKLGIITYIAHPDYFMLGRRLYSRVCEKAAHQIARLSVAYDVPLEINLNGFQYGMKQYCFEGMSDHIEMRYPYPFREFWEVASAYGCKVLYGYDAHSPISLLEREREDKANDILHDIPLNFIDSLTLK